MDDQAASGAVVETDSSVVAGTTENMNTTDPAPATDTPADPNPQTPPVPTGPAPETPDPGLPDHGIDPDKGIDPDAGDEPTTPESPQEAVDLKKMSRAERAEYFRDIQTEAKKQVETAIDAAYGTQDVRQLQQAYMDQGADEFQALQLARQDVADQRAELNDQRTQIAELNAGLVTDAVEVMSTIEWANPNNKESYDEKSVAAGSQIYDALCVTRDPNTAKLDAQGKPIPGTGEIIQVKMMPSQFWGLMNDIRSSGNETARVQAQKAAEQQMAAVAPPSSNTNKRETPFDNLSAADMRAQLLAKGISVT